MVQESVCDGKKKKHYHSFGHQKLKLISVCWAVSALLSVVRRFYLCQLSVCVVCCLILNWRKIYNTIWDALREKCYNVNIECVAMGCCFVFHSGVMMQSSDSTYSSSRAARGPTLLFLFIVTFILPCFAQINWYGFASVWIKQFGLCVLYRFDYFPRLFF